MLKECGLIFRRSIGGQFRRQVWRTGADGPYFAPYRCRFCPFTRMSVANWMGSIGRSGNSPGRTTPPAG